MPRVARHLRAGDVVLTHRAGVARVLRLRAGIVVAGGAATAFIEGRARCGTGPAGTGWLALTGLVGLPGGTRAAWRPEHASKSEPQPADQYRTSYSLRASVHPRAPCGVLGTPLQE